MMAHTLKKQALADIARRDQLHELLSEYIGQFGADELLTAVQGAVKERGSKAKGCSGARWNDLADCLEKCAETALRLETYGD
jgi:methionine salvage enolase-phosphatase E1